ncbi:hypothetical protein HPB48_021735 [Haemaphysalis longicornis]|uniref:Endonuclease-reverse transcriptase n=1 Tax=Haemaphysalis longicornis TaxID=44386 RepID=A0A9J6FLJ9_HAELO|nr:hypothetical protein HPB48_021735 [Haemaphysalis longicornis]
MTKMEDALQKIKDQGKKISQLTKTVTNLNVTLSRQEERLISLEDRSRRNNLLVFGVEEGEAETTEDLEQTVLQDIFVRKLGVELKTVERIHRIGRKGGSLPRPVIMKLYDSREKLTVYKNCKKLKGTTISVGDDFCKETLAKRKLLWESGKEEREAGQRMHLNYDKLVIDKDVYSWDYDKNCRVKLKHTKKKPRRSDDDD